MNSERTYTYRNGQKVELEKQPDQFVVRALPEELETSGIADVFRKTTDRIRE